MSRTVGIILYEEAALPEARPTRFSSVPLRQGLGVCRWACHPTFRTDYYYHVNIGLSTTTYKPAVCNSGVKKLYNIKSLRLF